ncbi:hypothetical protein ISF_00833 [Cordyceps fumosorosea ARSEF 2679]|uniref:Polymer-forming cytoskeletal protein n=1 Tax=Cordyceps fumosorosea (strain ARSEF 2679) TaxID=1081104 RepID=A0A162JUD9_CORFA|nr:hypothetical protein ISF_00833 [Cordyceps fumosorosea ARSEF 2679]OAA73932.1 hypothetical protein ISF_00833 [Cordyceps fumosorosea ARSEF 2679]
MDSPEPKPSSPPSQPNPAKAYPSPTSLPSPEVPQFQEFSRIPPLALDSYTNPLLLARPPPPPPPPPPCTCATAAAGAAGVFHHAGSSRSGAVYGLDFARSRSVHDESRPRLELAGPLDVAGSVRARSVCFRGDFIVSDGIDAYGDVEINGSMTAEGRIRAFGDISVNGSLTTSGKVQGSSRLKLRGTIRAADVEIYGNVILRGHL